MKSSDIYTLYAITDRRWLGGRSLADAVEEALAAGVTLLQLREKDMADDEFLSEAVEIKRVTDRYGVPLIINDNVEIALKCGAAGVHVGHEDMAARRARKMLGEGRLLGVTAKTPEDAAAAEKAGADYLGSGAVFGTSTKKGAKNISLDALRSICRAVKIPVTAIGGISEENAQSLAGTGISGIDVVSAIFASKDITASVKKLREIAEKITRE